MLIGAVADNLTGATDLALMLVREGMRTLQVIGVPQDAAALSGYDAVVVALKSRTIPAERAVAQSVAAAEVLLGAGARQIFFKYCSTFNSTAEGNIGPVTDALMVHLGTDLTIVCPAFPATGRTVYRGHLFVGDLPLDESPMKDHPLTPMRDSSLIRLMARQTSLSVGLVSFDHVNAGPAAVMRAFDDARQAGHRVVVVDAICERHLRTIGEAVAGMPLVTGGSGIAIGLPANFVREGLLQPALPTSSMAAPAGRAAVLAGSCSAATRGQVTAAAAAGLPSFQIEPSALAEGRLTADDILEWAQGHREDGPIVIYSSADPEAVRATQDALGRDRAGSLIEETLADVARGLVDDGVTRLVVAGGETSGAVVAALDLAALEIGPEIDPGVPWTRSIDGRQLALALKSGNFGSQDFFLKAWSLLR